MRGLAAPGAGPGGRRRCRSVMGGRLLVVALERGGRGIHPIPVPQRLADEAAVEVGEVIGDRRRHLVIAGEHDRRAGTQPKPGSCRDVEGRYPTLDPTPGPR